MNSVLFSSFDELAAYKLYTERFAATPTSMVDYLHKNLFLVCIILFLAILINTTLPFIGLFTGFRPQEVSEEVSDTANNVIDILHLQEQADKLKNRYSKLDLDLDSTSDKKSEDAEELKNTVLKQNVVVEKIRELNRLSDVELSFLRLSQDVLRHLSLEEIKELSDLLLLKTCLQPMLIVNRLFDFRQDVSQEERVEGIIVTTFLREEDLDKIKVLRGIEPESPYLKEQSHFNETIVRNCHVETQKCASHSVRHCVVCGSVRPTRE